LLPIVLTVDDADTPNDVINALVLTAFVANDQPYAQTIDLTNVRDDASLLPRGVPNCASRRARRSTPAWPRVKAGRCGSRVPRRGRTPRCQALSRLLNLTDGLLGQGRKVLVAITTNEDLTRLHPAVVRPGRCLARIECPRYRTTRPSPGWVNPRAFRPAARHSPNCTRCTTVPARWSNGKCSASAIHSMTNNDLDHVVELHEHDDARGTARTLRVRRSTSAAAVEALAVHDIDDVTVTVVGYG
jgi:hypothetical protein